MEQGIPRNGGRENCGKSTEVYDRLDDDTQSRVGGSPYFRRWAEWQEIILTISKETMEE